MCSSNLVRSFALVATVLVSGLVRAEMGAVWVEEVGWDSITINWSDPTGIHRFATAVPIYRICVEEVNPYTNSYPAFTASDCKDFTGASSKPHKITGLSANTYYRIKVEARAEKRTTAGEWVSSFDRQLATIKQKTKASPLSHNLRLAGATRDAIKVEFVNTAPGDFATIRLAYAQKWSDVDLSAVAGDALGPDVAWGESNGLRGWQDVPSGPVISATFSGLSPDQPYEVMVFGHRIGITDGVRLGSVTGETAGYRPLPSVEACLAADHQDELVAYSSWLTSLPGDPEQPPSPTLIDMAAQDFPTLVTEDLPFVSANHGDDLRNGLTALLFLIDARHPEYEYWQVRLSGAPDRSLRSFLEAANPWLLETLEREKDPSPQVFQRGDANSNGEVNISDAQRMLGVLFLGSGKISCMDAADSNDSGALDMSDAVYVLNALFLGASPIPEPFGVCGPDPTDDDLACEEYSICSP